ncbi:hypothetical protein ETAA8_35730 [Anatilimnocola aggregata]|uniref:Carboxypeptidase regulatory-like domain-containing protein n=1 Tax=Anatilimnocola aggregata TaxID=2528021 RepID=A0A517YE81_9BACT|nr:hypothetical protein [Anatilimnocola aggregata]QDU28472.1 hypothetical protein ETAA8_35730 [Anatilimnocola aggregata]
MHRSIHSGRLGWFALACISGLAGCSSDVHPVEGLVVWKDNQQPASELAGSLIQFELPDLDMSSRGQIKADGSFQLTTHQQNDGAPLGEHIVLIIEVGRQSINGGSQLAPGKIDTRYASPRTTDLKVTVTPGKNQPQLEVERFKL